MSLEHYEFTENSRAIPSNRSDGDATAAANCSNARLDGAVRRFCLNISRQQTLVETVGTFNPELLNSSNHPVDERGVRGRTKRGAEIFPQNHHRRLGTTGPYTTGFEPTYSYLNAVCTHCRCVARVDIRGSSNLVKRISRSAIRGNGFVPLLAPSFYYAMGMVLRRFSRCSREKSSRCHRESGHVATAVGFLAEITRGQEASCDSTKARLELCLEFRIRSGS